MINHSNHAYPWWIGLSVPKFINMGFLILLVDLSQSHLLSGSLFALAHFVEMSYIVILLTLGILCRTLLPWLVFIFPTPHALAFHPWGFSRLMSRIRRSLLYRFILCLGFSISHIFLVLSLLVLPIVIWKFTEAVESKWLRLL